MTRAGEERTGHPLPPGARLIHAGMPKTGTTALQRTAAGRRELLLAHGVSYPGRATNHRRAMFAYSARPTGWVGSAAPSRARWSHLRAQIHDDDQRRLWLSNENLSDEPEDVLRSMLDEVAGQATVVLTVRSLPAQLASSWQQYLKSGVWVSFETWLQRVIGDTPDPATTPSFARRIDLGGVVEKWVRVVGAEHVVVVVLDPSDRSLVPRTFEELLGLPSGVLEAADLEGHNRNRSMTASEAELLRRLNRAVRKRGGVSWEDYERFVRDGAVEAMLARDAHAAEEDRIVPPSWAVERAAALGRAAADRIAGSGVGVVGELDRLAAPVPSVHRARPARTVPVDVAAQALSAVVTRAGELRPLDEVRASTLVRHLGGRVLRRLARAGVRPSRRRNRRQ